ncbi:MAG: hypothetical protein ACTHPO_09270 [Alphaproteobacteria bacterium]
MPYAQYAQCTAAAGFLAQQPMCDRCASVAFFYVISTELSKWANLRV